MRQEPALVIGRPFEQKTQRTDASLRRPGTAIRRNGLERAVHLRQRERRMTRVTQIDLGLGDGQCLLDHAPADSNLTLTQEPGELEGGEFRLLTIRRSLAEAIGEQSDLFGLFGRPAHLGHGFNQPSKLHGGHYTWGANLDAVRGWGEPSVVTEGTSFRLNG